MKNNDEYKDWCSSFTRRWNAMSLTPKITKEECLDIPFVRSIFDRKSCPNQGGTSRVDFKSPEDAAELAVSYSFNFHSK